MDLEKIAFDKNFSLSFGSSNQKRMYGFCYEIFENDILKNQIHYEVEVNFLTDNSGRNCIFEINRKQFYINNKTPNSKIEQIAEKASQTIFPLRVKIKNNGEIEEVFTSNSSKKRWLSVKQNIIKYYKGEATAKIIDKIETVLLNDDLLKQSICQNWFFHLYFKPLYAEYTSKLRFKSIWESPVFGNQFIEYGAVHTIKDHYDNDDKININAAGFAIDERTLEEIMQGYNFPKKYLSEETFETVDSKMNVDYKLYKEDRSIFSVTGTFETKINENTQRKIQVEIYHFPENSSFKPWNDAALKESKRIFQSYQTKDEEDIIDVAAMIIKRQELNPKIERILGSVKEKNQFYIPEEPIMHKKMSFADKVKSVFKKKK
ncbi:hypothetical protein IRZ71_16165 [Flavobacterium sp. ANB]|uniref:hypothetical protein n=1 Tax=unclassified Flavobacterium TaxID=196869 RepID=UPI0012B9BBB0|nr:MULTISPECIES: hypothetical protein [unclassified Flavobacterium]MBF4517902.1 hypothetical protein [Flavobacterium sp. ANB]MTD72028.1 hypothetical protein [Flavobacterium sp. LC2016-13]